MTAADLSSTGYLPVYILPEGSGQSAAPGIRKPGLPSLRGFALLCVIASAVIFLGLRSHRSSFIDYSRNMTVGIVASGVTNAINSTEYVPAFSGDIISNPSPARGNSLPRMSVLTEHSFPPTTDSAALGHGWSVSESLPKLNTSPDRSEPSSRSQTARRASQTVSGGSFSQNIFPNPTAGSEANRVGYTAGARSPTNKLVFSKFAKLSDASMRGEAGRPTDVNAVGEPSEFEVRQSGKGKHKRLLKNIEGPAAATNIATHAGFRVALEAGSMKTSRGPRGYDYGATSFSAKGLDVSAEFAADELNNAATMVTLHQKISGAFGVAFTQLSNSGFESFQTGTGKNLVRRFTEWGFDGGVGSSWFGIGMRDLMLRSGQLGQDLRTYSWIPLGSIGSLNHSTVIRLPSTSIRATQNTFELVGNIDQLSYSLELDYGDGVRLRPVGYAVTLDRPVGQSWSISSYAGYSGWDHGLAAGVGVMKKLGKVILGPSIDMDSRGHGQAWLRAWLPLGQRSAPYQWLSPGQHANLQNAGRADDWCLRAMICH